MYPIFFEGGGVTLYSYGLMIALGTIVGVAYMAIQGKREVGLTLDQANALFLFIFLAAFVGGKAFLLLENTRYYIDNPQKLLAGRGFVFYGSFLFAVPSMLLFFRRHRLPTYAMLDIMAVTTCLVHFFGRLGCFMAGCCYGAQTNAFASVVFSDPACQASPLNTPLHPTQLYEASYILLVMMLILFLRKTRRFYGQLFLTYLMAYALGRFVLEYLRGDLERGYVVSNYVSYAQFTALMIIAIVLLVYRNWSAKNQVTKSQIPI